MHTAKRGIIGGIIFLVVIALAAGAFWYLKDPSGQDDGSQGVPTGQGGEGEKKDETTRTSPPPAVTSSAKKLRLLAPNGGEKWERGKQYNVRWVSELPSNIRVKASIFKTNSVVSDPYAGSGIAGRDMFAPSLFPAGSNEGSYTYLVPRDLAPGTYQVVIWGGETCSSVNKAKRCEYDLSNALFTIR